MSGCDGGHKMNALRNMLIKKLKTEEAKKLIVSLREELSRRNVIDADEPVFLFEFSGGVELFADEIFTDVPPEERRLMSCSDVEESIEADGGTAVLSSWNLAEYVEISVTKGGGG